MTNIVTVGAGQRTNQYVSSGGMPATVRLQTLDGTWEVVGTDRVRGIYAEDISLTANTFGSDTCRFTLKRSIDLSWPDLGAFTPCEVEIGGTVVWGGRVWQTPNKTGDDAAIYIEGRGWQYHLDDDLYMYPYLARDLSKFVDTRSLLNARLDLMKSPGNVNVGGGGVSMVWPANAPMTGWDNPGGAATALLPLVGITYDLGAHMAYTALGGWLKWQSSANATGTAPDIVQFRTSRNNSHYPWGTPYNVTNAVRLDTASGSTRIDSGGNPGRYFHIFLENGSSSVNPPYTSSKEFWLKLTDFALGYASANFDGSNATTSLTANSVINDALNYCPLIRKDTSGVAGAQFLIPEFVVDSPSTPREIMQAVNAYHNYALWTDVNAKLYWQPLPSYPQFQVGSWTGSDFDDASANSGEEVYNKVVVSGTSASGDNVYVERGSSVSGTNWSAVQPLNPSFAVDTSNWQVEGGSTQWGAIARDTSVFDTSPASLRVSTLTVTNAGGGSSPGGSHALTTGWTAGQTFKRGRTYRLRVRMQFHANFVNGVSSALYGDGLDIRFGTGYDSGSLTITRTSVSAGQWYSFDIVWRPKYQDYVVGTDTVTLTFNYQGQQSNAILYYIDSLQVFDGGLLLADRRGFTKTKALPVSNSITNESAAQIGDVFLANHDSTPMRGQLTVIPGGVRKVLDGGEVHPSELLIGTNQLVRFTDRIDPDTGSLGREGRVAAVSYDHNAQTAAVTIDNENRNFEALLSRLAVVTGAATRGN